MAKGLSSSQHAKPQLDSIYPQVHFPAIWLTQDLLILNSSKESLGSPQELPESPGIKCYMHCFLYTLFPCLVEWRFLLSINYSSMLFTLLEISFLPILAGKPLYIFKLVSNVHYPEQLFQTATAQWVCCPIFYAVTLTCACLPDSLCHSAPWLSFWRV